MGCIVHGVIKSRTRLSDFHFTFTYDSETLMFPRGEFSVLSQRKECFLLLFQCRGFFPLVLSKEAWICICVLESAGLILFP